MVKLTAVPDTGYYFTGWSGDVTGTDNPIDITVGSEKDITATFEILVLDLEVIVKGEGQVSQAIVEGTGAENENRSTVTQYEYGTIVELTPTPSDGMAFISWSGDYIGEEDPLQLTMTESTSIQANFDYELLIKVVGKWKIKKKTQDRSRWSLYSIIFKRNYSYTINTSRGQVRGSFKVKSNSEIDLVGYGSLSNVDLTKNTTTNTWGNFRFRITVPGEIEEEEVATEVDNNYKPVVNEETGETVERTYVPDDNFEQTLIDLGYDDTLDDYVNTENIKTIENLDVSEKNITDLTGIEDAINLINLNAQRNQISGNLNFSFNPKVETVDLAYNSLKEIEFNDNQFLRKLWLYNNNTIDKLEILNSPELEELTIHDNKITEVDIKNSPKIKNIRIWNNPISSLDISHLNDLQVIYAWDLSGPITIGQISNLRIAGLDRNNFGSLDLSLMEKLEGFSCNDCGISEITLPKTDKLRVLDLSNNSLSKLDLSNTPNIDILRISNNNLYCITIDQNKLLNTPPTCSDSLFENTSFSCFDLGFLDNILGYSSSSFYTDPDSSPNISYPSSWVTDEYAVYNGDCDTYVDVCEISVDLTSGSANQSMLLGNTITSNIYTLSSTCLVSPTYSVSASGLPPGLSLTVENNIASLSGSPSSAGNFGYNLTFMGTNSSNSSITSVIVTGILEISGISISSSLTGGSQSQTVTATNSITEVQYTFSSNYDGSLSASADNLPPGVSLSFNNNVASLNGTATTSGTYNYNIIVSAGTTQEVVQGIITVNSATTTYKAIPTDGGVEYMIVYDWDSTNERHRVLMDKRMFNSFGGASYSGFADGAPESIFESVTKLSLYDVYDSNVEYISNDIYWATYYIYTNITNAINNSSNAAKFRDADGYFGVKMGSISFSAN